MRKLNSTLLLILFTCSLFGQMLEDKISIEDKEFNDFFLNKENIPVVKGKILNVTEKDIEKAIIRYSIITPVGNKQNSKTCQLSSDGTFELELDYAIPYQQIWISVGRIYHAFIYANADLHIELDLKILKFKKGVDYIGPGIKYLGIDGELNTYINNHAIFEIKRQLELEDKIRHFMSRSDLQGDVLMEKYDSTFHLLNEIDRNYIQQNPSEYSWIIEDQRLSDYYSNLLVNFHNRGGTMSQELLEKIRRYKPYVMSRNSMGFYNKRFFYEMTYSNISQYKFDVRNLSSYSKLTQKQKLLLDSLTSVWSNRGNIQHMDSIQKTLYIEKANSILHDTIKVAQYLSWYRNIDSIYDRPKADFFKLNFIGDSPSENKFILEALLSNLETEWCRKVVESEYQQNHNKLSKVNDQLAESEKIIFDKQLGEFIAETPTGAKLYIVDNIQSEILLKNIKNNFQGNALLIDFWATWCGPCMTQLPYSNKLHKEMENMPVKFIYICTSQNSTKEDWVSKIIDLKLSGIQLFLEKEKVKDLMDLFSISGFPSSVFIDSKGVYKSGTISNMINLDKEKLIEIVNEK